MRPRRREWAPAGAVLALALTAACAPSGRSATGPSSPPAASPKTPVVSASALPSPVTPPGRKYVIGVIGDYGFDALPVRQVVRAMRGFDGGRPLDAVATTGDNAYCCGTAEQARFARRLLDPVLRGGTKLYPSLGNHDVYTDGGPSFMNAFPMAKRWYTANVGPVQLVVLDSTRTSSRTQLAFLRGVLATPRPGSFRVVLFHHPGWSCSAHPPEPGVVQRWLPIFGDDVDLVLAGHNHTYERFSGLDGTTYVTTGGGGAKLYASSALTCRGTGKVRFVRTAHHAVRLVATRASLRVDAVGLDGKTFDSVTLAPR